MSKLSPDLIVKIQERLEQGCTVRAVAAEFGVPKSTVSDYNKKRIDKIAIASRAVVSAVQVIDSLPKKQQDAVFSSAKKALSMQHAHASAGQSLSNLAALISNAAHLDASMMSQSDLTNPEKIAPLMASVRTANEALHGSLQIAQLEIKQGLNRSELDSMSEGELRDELRRLGR